MAVPSRFLQRHRPVHPGLWLTICVLAGTAAGLLSAVPPLEWLSAAIAVLSVTLLLPSGQARTRMLLTAALLASAGQGGAARDRALAPPLQTWLRSTIGEERATYPVVVHGVLWADAAAVEGGVRIEVDTRRIETSGTRHAVSGRLRLHVSGALAAPRVADWTAGRAFHAPVMLREPHFLANPGGPTETWQRLHQEADLLGTVKSAALVTVIRGAWWDEAAAAVRRRVRRAAARLVAPHSDQSAAIVTAILIGDRAGLADDIQRRLRVAGTYHVIAISGGNVAILTALCLFVLHLLIRSFRGVAVISMGLVLTYGWIVGAEPSVRRAVTAASIYLGLSLIGASPRAVDVLALTACALALIDPLIAIDPGAWLSFGATLGIVLGAARFMRWAAGSEAARVSVPRRAWLLLLGLLGATVAAELMLVPLSAALFARVSLLGLILNFVAIPAMTVVQLAGAVTVGAAGWADPVAAGAASLAHLAASGLVASSAAADAAPWLVWRVPPASMAWTASYYAALSLCVWLRGWGPRRRAALVATCLCLAGIVTAPGLEWSRPPPGQLRVTLLDVGQGDAIAVQLPDGQSLLVDTGGTVGPFDLGGRVVTPALWALGIRRLDWLALTHPDIDHIGAAPAVIDDLAPREVWEGIPVPPHAPMLALRRQAHAARVAWRPMLRGHTIEMGAVVLDVRHPPPPEWERRRVRNEDSVVIRLRFGSVELLLTGDAGLEFESAFSREDGRAPLRLLKVGHHGSKTSSAAPFLHAFAPQVALISAGRANPFGHPAPEVLERYRDIGAVVFRTDLDGAVMIETDGATVDVRGMRGKHWRLISR